MPPGPFLAGRSKANLYSWNISPGRSWSWPLIHCAAPFPYQRPDTLEQVYYYTIYVVNLKPLAPERFFRPALSFCGVSCML